MTKKASFSAYLDLLRFTAALLVVLEHAAILGLLPRLGIATALSHESVIAFFVLSGLVIADSSWVRQTSARAYVAARSARVLSVSLPAVMCCFAVAAFWPSAPATSGRTLAVQFASSAVFLNGVWTNYIDVPFNGPYWSLCHEVWYYACWGILRFSTRFRTRVIGVALLLLAMGPAFAALSGVWLMGAFVAAHQRAATSRRVPPFLRMVLFAATLAGVAVIAGSGLQDGVRAWLQLHVHAWWRMRTAEYLVTDYLIGGLVAAHLVAAAWLFGDGRHLAESRFGHLVRQCAGVTFTLYLFHYPMLLAFRAMRGPRPASLLEGIAAIALTLAGVWVVSLVTERQLPRWRRMTTAVVDRAVALAAFAKSAIDQRAVQTLMVRLLILAGGFVSSILTARWLSPAGRGEYFLVVTLAQLFAQFGTFGLASSNTYFAAQPGQRRAGALLANSLWVSIVVGGVGSAVVILVIESMGGAAWGGRLWFAALLAPATLFYMLGTNLLVGLKRIGTYNWFQFASNYGVLLCLAAAALLGAGSTGFAAASAIGWTIVSALLLYICRKGHPESLRFSLPVFRAGTQYALKAYVATLCGYLILRSNVFLLNAVQGPVQVGHFSVASQIADVVGILPQSMALVLFPTLIEASTDRFKTMMRNLATAGGLLGAGCLVLALLAEPFIRIVFGPKFAESAAVLRWMLPGAFLLGLTSIASQYLAACGFPVALSGVWVGGAIVAASAGWLLIPAGGAVGAAIALSIAHAAVFAGVFGLCLLHFRRDAHVPTIFAHRAQEGVAVS